MTNLRKWSTTATGNATVAGGANTINFAEGQNPSTVNNSMREQMAQIRKTYTPDEWGWVDCSATASVASQTTFKLTGNQTADYTANRRTRLKSGSTTRYGTIVSSSFTTETTVTITVDSGSLSASHTLAAVAAITSDHIPANTYVTSDSLSAVLATYITSASASAAFVTSNSLSAAKATAANFRANTADKFLITDTTWSAGAEVTLTDAATIAVDMSTFINAIVTLAGNRTLGQPSNTKVSQSGCIRIVQDATGSRTLAYHADWKFAGGTDPTLTTTANATDLLFYQVIATNFIYATLVKALA